MKQFFLIFLLLHLVCSTILAQSYKSTVDVQAKVAPTIFNMNGLPSCYYELFITNFSGNVIRLKKLEVVSGVSQLLISDSLDLFNRVSMIGQFKKDSGASLKPGGSAVVYIELSSTALRENSSLQHRLTITVEGTNKSEEETIRITPIRLLKSKLPPLGAPLSKGIWTAVYSAAWERGHRRVIYTLNGEARIPGRFAIDFIMMDEKGRYASGEENLIKNWYGYGAQVLAVADGIVASVDTSFSESSTVANHPDYSPDKATGNYISLKIGDRAFAFYEHLKPGSIKVRPGQKVKKGDVIASLGFTGQTTGPHLHFHVADRDSPLGAEGIPFVFEKFEVLGNYERFEEFGKKKWIERGLNSSKTNKSRPIPNAVLRFTAIE